MIRDVERLLEDFTYHDGNCEIEVCFNEKLCKILHDVEYDIDESGKLVFQREMKWTNQGLVVHEMSDIISKYKDDITEILFETSEGTFENFLNSYEVKADMSNTLYRLRLLVGNDSEMTLTDNAILRGDTYASSIMANNFQNLL